jgi:hypothetical protein
MFLILDSYCLVLLFLVAHVVVWKISLPRRPIRALLIIAGAVFCLRLGLLTIRPKTFPELLQTTLFFWSVSLCYAITYSAIEGGSPTLSLMRFLADGRTHGRTLQEIDAFFAERPFVRTRITRLLDSSLIKEENGRYFAADKPSAALRLVLGFRRFYGIIPKGG